MSVILKKIIRKAILTGEFELRSGKKSNYYIDKSQIITNPQTLTEIATQINKEHMSHRVTKIAGAELGGVPLAIIQSLYTGLPSVYIRNSKKKYGAGKKIEGELIEGDVVLLLEDVTTTGEQVIEAAKELVDLGAEIFKIISVVDREEGAKENIEAAGFKFASLINVSDLKLKVRK